MLAVFKTRQEGYSELIIQHSPWVAYRDEVFTPVLTEVVGLCVTVDDCREVLDEGMNFGKSRFLTLRVHDLCPGSGDHICATESDHLDRIFKY